MKIMKASWWKKHWWKVLAGLLLFGWARTKYQNANAENPDA